MSTWKPRICLVAAMLVLPGCATKTYGRLEPVSAADALDCRTLDQQISAAEAFKADVKRESDAFDGAAVLAFLIDFGIGNHIEKEAALESADARTASLVAQRKAKHCDSPSMEANASHQPR